VGAIVLANVEQGVLEESVLRGWLKGALTRADDRALLGCERQVGATGRVARAIGLDETRQRM